MFVKKEVKNLGGKYSRINIGAKSAFWYVISNVIQKISVFLCTPIFTRFLSTEQYGQYEVYKSWYSIIIVFATLNLFYSGYTAGITKFENDGNNFTTAMVGLCMTISVIVGVIFIAFQSRYQMINIETKYCYAMVIEIIGFALFSLWVAYQRFYYQYKMIVLMSTVMSIGTALSSVVAVVILPNNLRLSAKIYIDAGAWFIVGMVCLARVIVNSRQFFKLKYWIFGLKNNIPLIPHYLSGTILNQSDKLMIAEICGTEEVAIYGLAYSMAMFLTAVSSAIQNAFNPYLYRKLNLNDIGNTKKITNTLILILGIICCLIILVIPEIIIIIAPEQYWNAKYVMAPVVCSVYFIFLNSLFSSVEHFYGKTLCILASSCFCALLNIILNYLYIPRLGYIAAGYTTLICYCILALINLFFADKIIRKNGINKYYDKKFILFNSIVMILLTIIITCLYKYFILRSLMFLSICILACFKKNSILNTLYMLKSEK